MNTSRRPGQLSPAEELDLAVRQYVYDQLFNRQRVPGAAEIARALHREIDGLRQSLRRMKDGHILVLQEGDQEILMANPFSAVPTPFVVQIGDRSWWGNCIWDALGIAAMVKGEATITTGCGDCNDEMVIRVEGGQAWFEDGNGVIHFSVPARRWWDNIKFT